MKQIRFIDLFGGIGGFRLGLERANKEIGEDIFKCVWYNDNNKYATKVYNYNFEENYEPKDIRKIKEEEIPEFDMLCAGFPCQAFSIAGKRGGFQDTRGTLFFEIARILEVKRPKIVFLENVKGLLNHKKGETFKVILQTLDELGYETQWMVLNSKFFGVPQNRERVFIIGYIRGESRPEILPINPSSREIPEIPEGQVPIVMNLQTRDINRPAIKKRIEAGLKPNAGSGTIGKENEAYCLDGSCSQGVSVPDVVRDLSPKKKEEILRDMDYVTTLDTSGYVRRLGGWNGKSLSERTLRRLTPNECERLQGFPEDWTSKGKDSKGEEEDISDNQRYKQLGNAVTSNVITAIGIRLGRGELSARHKDDGKGCLSDSKSE